MYDRDFTNRSFEELERDEFRRMETLGATVDEMIESIFGEVGGRPGSTGYNYDDDDED